MAIVNQQFGLPEAGAAYHGKWFCFHETLVFNGGTTLTDRTLSSETKDPIYMNATKLAQRSNQANFTIAAIKANYCMEFTQQNTSEPVFAQRYRFENYSRLKFTINDVVFDELPLSLFLPYNQAYRASTTETVLAKFQEYYFLKDPIEFPYGGNAEIKYVAPNTVVTAASANTNMHLTGTPGVTITSNQGWVIDIWFLGRIVVPK